MLKDIVATTVTFPTEDAFFHALNVLKKSKAVLTTKERYEKPLPSGYRDVSMTVVLSTGYLFELQLTTDNMLAAKGAAGHVMYKIMRTIEKHIGKPGVIEVYRGLEKLSQEYYKWAYSDFARKTASDRAIDLDKLNAFSSDMGVDAMRISKALSGSDISTLLESSTLNKFLALSSQTKGTSSESKNVSDIKPPPENNNITPEEKKAKDKQEKKPAPV